MVRDTDVEATGAVMMYAERGGVGRGVYTQWWSRYRANNSHSKTQWNLRIHSAESSGTFGAG